MADSILICWLIVELKIVIIKLVQPQMSLIKAFYSLVPFNCILKIPMLCLFLTFLCCITECPVKKYFCVFHLSKDHNFFLFICYAFIKFDSCLEDRYLEKWTLETSNFFSMTSSQKSHRCQDWNIIYDHIPEIDKSF